MRAAWGGWGCERWWEGLEGKWWGERGWMERMDERRLERKDERRLKRRKGVERRCGRGVRGKG